MNQKMNRQMFKFIMTFIVLFSLSSFASTAKQVRGIVQYSDGTTFNFKDLLFSNQQININEKSKLKILLDNNCIAVLYGAGSNGSSNLKFPENSSDAIELTGGASRWI